MYVKRWRIPGPGVAIAPAPIARWILLLIPECVVSAVMRRRQWCRTPYRNVRNDRSSVSPARGLSVNPNDLLVHGWASARLRPEISSRPRWVKRV